MVVKIKKENGKALKLNEEQKAYRDGTYKHNDKKTQ